MVVVCHEMSVTNEAGGIWPDAAPRRDDGRPAYGAFGIGVGLRVVINSGYSARNNCDSIDDDIVTEASAPLSSKCIIISRSRRDINVISVFPSPKAGEARHLVCRRQHMASFGRGAAVMAKLANFISLR